MPRTLSSVLLLAPVILLLAVGCGGDKDDILAQVGQNTITVTDFQKAYQRMKPADRPSLDGLEGKQAFLQDLINKQLMELSAFEKYPELNRQQNWRLQRSREGALKSMVEQALVRSQVDVTEAMKDTLYRNMSRELHAQGMLILEPEEARYVRQKLSEGRSFTDLAQAHSARWVSEGSIGDMGWVKPGGLPYPVDVALWNAAMWDTLGPLDTPRGSYIFVVMEEREVSPEGSREGMDAYLDNRILEQLYLERQKAVQDSIWAAAEPYYPGDGKALLMEKYYYELPPELAASPTGYLDAERVVPTFTAEEAEMVVVSFKNRPDWTAKEFAERLSWTPAGLWPRGDSEAQLVDAMDLLVREYLKLETARDMGFDKSQEFLNRIDEQARKMRVNYFYYNDILESYEPKEAEIREYFEEFRNNYRLKPAYKVAFFESKNEGLIDDLTRDWRAGASFRDVRDRYSAIDPELRSVGETVWLYEGQDRIRDDIVATLKEGGVSDSFPYGEGFIAVQLIATRDARLATYDEIKDQVDEDAKAHIVDKKLTEFLANQGEKYGVTINEQALERLDIPEVVSGT